ncbi:MAG: hypothetical protein FWD71_13375 [Oscillospiraceae bacterium]|nr:hypothetical protein [Oscillospiraceae bacterium]
MNNLFQRTSSHWTRYSEYEYRKGADGIVYLTPAPKSKPAVYDPLKDGEKMVLDALNVGRLAMKKNVDEKLEQTVLEFVTKYGLLGFMTALPTTPQFMDYEAVYLPKNHFLKEETMSAQDYVALFFPFAKPDFYKDSRTAQWNVADDREMMALMMTFVDSSMATAMSLQRDYAERYDWLVTQFRDWAFTLVSSFLYYEDYDHIDETTRDLYRQGISTFGGTAPTYHIALYDKPTIVWDFHSLLLGVQMMFSFMLTDEKKPLRVCKHCTAVFAATHPNAVFCSPKCKNQYNVYKSREKNKE